MATTCTANYVDRLLIKLDGAVCPIWNSLFFLVDALPEPDVLFRALTQLINEAPRLKSLWSEQLKGWIETVLDNQKIGNAFQYDTKVLDKNHRLQQLIKTPINLLTCLPLQLSVGKIEGRDWSWLIGFQIHHAAGDGRALIHMVQRYWDLLNQLLNDAPNRCAPLSAPHMTDRSILKTLWPHKKSLSCLLHAKYRQLSRRGDALTHEAIEVGSPSLHSVRVHLPASKNHNSSELFYASLLAAIVQSEQATEDKIIRLRLPVDLRHFLNIPANSIENGCAAVILELSLNQLRTTYQQQPEQLGALVKNALTKSLKQRVYVGNALECIVISHITKAHSLKNAARAEILAGKRSSTLVMTHFGDLTDYIKPPDSIKVLGIQSHTPVWGSNSLVYEGALYTTITCFDGLWPEEKLSQFSLDAKNWLHDVYQLSGEVV